MESVLEKLFTFADTIMQFFQWIYDSAFMIGDYISEKWVYITDLIAAVPAEWGVAVAVMSAAALLYLVLGR